MRRCLLVPMVVVLLAGIARAEETALERRLQTLDTSVLEKEVPRASLLARQIRNRLQEANDRESTSWRALKGRTDWEGYRDQRIRALKGSLGTFPAVPKDLKVRVTRTLKGEGYQIDNLVYESRPGLLVTGNLYRPARPGKGMPGLLICHSHHAPKSEGELQDMGVSWARAGCLVLVIDQLGHGERRQHPFRSSADYPGSFRVGRQDYYFRYPVSLQLHLAGESLTGWMAWDMMRGVDLLLAQPGIDRDKIVLLGSVAGGGDPAAVTAALDARIQAVVPFNFGGPQPETRYPLPADAEKTFNYSGGGSWESTRNLARSAADGFLPWVIVGSVAPRRLVYGHEFSWDRERDPVWARLQRINGWYDSRDHLAFTHGKGLLSGMPPEASHCNNIGAPHRVGIHQALQRWFGIEVKESRDRHSASDLACLTPDLKTQPVHELAARLGEERAGQLEKRLAPLSPDARRATLRKEWARLLGGVEVPGKIPAQARGKESLPEVTVERFVLEVDAGMPIPLVLLLPAGKAKARYPVVVGFAQQGKQAFLTERASDINALLRGGMAVVLPDLRGTGETRPGEGRGRSSAAVALASSELMLGKTLLGARLRDLRGVLAWVRTRADLDADRLALWGDSFAPVNPPDVRVAVPLDADKSPSLAEPLGGILTLLAGLFEEKVSVLVARGGLIQYRSVLDSPFLYVPGDVIVPGALPAGDLSTVAAVLSPRHVRLEAVVDGANRLLSTRNLEAALAGVRAKYGSPGVKDKLVLLDRPNPTDTISNWLLGRLKEK